MKNKGLKVMSDFFREKGQKIMEYQIKEREIGGIKQTREEEQIFESVRSYMEREGKYRNYQQFEGEREKERK